MNAKRCGKRWTAHLCAPGAQHECTRPPMHPGKCCCKCGAWPPPEGSPAARPDEWITEISAHAAMKAATS